MRNANIQLEPLLLASASPRRAEILRAVGWPFETAPVDIDESVRQGEEPVAYVERLALGKAEAALTVRSAERRLILGADTTVVIDGDILGKPEDDSDAQTMIERLSGRWHDVITGLALVNRNNPSIRMISHQRTRVRFAPLSADQIQWYVSTGEPRDKAGAYAIQGRAALFVEAIEGDFWNVVGLPVQLLYRMAGNLRFSAAV